MHPTAQAMAKHDDGRGANTPTHIITNLYLLEIKRYEGTGDHQAVHPIPDVSQVGAWVENQSQIQYLLMERKQRLRIIIANDTIPGNIIITIN